MTVRPFLPSERYATPNHLRTVARYLNVKAEAMFGRGNAVALAEAKGYDQASIDTIKRGAVVPLATTTSGAPAATVLEVFASLMSPFSAAQPIMASAGRVLFGDAGAISIVGDETSAAGEFIEQGAPIPFGQLSLSAIPLVPKKFATGVVLTREMVTYTYGEEYTTRQVSVNVTKVFEDKLFDDTAGSTIRPAGLKYGISALTPDADDSIDGMMNDLANLGAAVAAVGTRIVFIASPKQFIKLMTRLPANFKFPIYPSAALGDKQIAALALEALTFGGQGDVQISISKTGAVVMQDTSPPQLSAVGTPATVAAPIRSLEQTDTIGLRLIMDIDWALRSPSGFAWTEDVAWG